MGLIVLLALVALVAVASHTVPGPASAPDASALPAGVAIGRDGVYTFRSMPMWWKRLEDPDMVDVVMSLADLTDVSHELFVWSEPVGWMRVLKRPGAATDTPWETPRP